MWDEVLRGVVTGEFDERLSEALQQQNLTIEEFAERYDISESTLYKITSGRHTNFGVETLQKIIHGIQEEEGYTQPTIGLITTRGACDRAPNHIEIDDVKYRIKPLPSQSIEEEIIRGVRAEKDGVDGLLCGPIAATTLEQVVDVPVGGLQFDTELIETSVEDFIRRIT
ncbi:helix-turn-helix domain-containing protein [Halobellus sp. Atlit-38R]|uniref:helix-turn-helix domain-containing protein n=1 Tax=Halobellus sp. Atlit-38R TaxID=2282131 RepID=UPI000EF1FA00|nr:helix-turn-helix domain-containing protein [Halobellus sp. Atlit-38R]RLM83643.1 helix-turn-helix domain-containing protein [Halobellus sp. Atlit-38R]